jgi:excisionase family DNA binding protein
LRCSHSYDLHGLEHEVTKPARLPLGTCGATGEGLRCIGEHEKAPMIEKLNSIRDAAARLAISPWTLRRFIDRGELRGVRVGRRVLVSEREILRVIQHGTGGRRVKR